MIPSAEAYLDAATVAADLLDNAAVARDWDKPSALADFSVRGLAGHLGGQVLAVPGLIAEPTPATAQVLTLDQHYGRAPWRGADLSETVNVEIRDGGERHAAAGHEALVARVRATLADLPVILADLDAQRSVFVPWNGWALAVNDFLTVRMLEIAVHNDDLAVSVGIDTPPLPARVMRPVYDVLFPLALHRHGDVAVLRALSRAERAPASIAAI